jgi:CheY-like chemotaxis protein
MSADEKPLVLVADDDVVSRRLIEIGLSRAGYGVLAVNDGRAAVETLTAPGGPRLALRPISLSDLRPAPTTTS